jgi:hypothetical protein
VSDPNLATSPPVVIITPAAEAEGMVVSGGELSMGEQLTFDDEDGPLPEASGEYLDGPQEEGERGHGD